MSKARKQCPAAERSDAHAEHVDRLADAVEEVAGQLEVLRQVLDEIREDFQWAVRNDRFRSEHPCAPLTSLPADPLAPDFGERVNRVKPEDLPEEAGSPDPELDRALEDVERSLAEEEPEAPPVAAPEPPPAPEPTPQHSRAKPTYTKTGKKLRPLYDRLFYQPHLTEVVRLLGYEGLPETTFWDHYRALSGKHGQEAMSSAVSEIVEFDKTQTPAVARLTEEARKLAGYVLGRPSGSAPPPDRG